MFGHRDAAAPLPVVQLTVRSLVTADEAKLSLSARHFMPAARNASATAIDTYAKDVQIGDVLAMVVRGQPSAAVVSAKHTTLERGAFNPYTQVM